MAWTHASCHDPNVLNMVGTKLILFMPRTNRHSLQGRLLFMAATKDVSCLWHGHNASCHEFPPRPPCSLLAIAVATEKRCTSRFRRNLCLWTTRNAMLLPWRLCSVTTLSRRSPCSHSLTRPVICTGSRQRHAVQLNIAAGVDRWSSRSHSPCSQWWQAQARAQCRSSSTCGQ